MKSQWVLKQLVATVLLSLLFTSVVASEFRLKGVLVSPNSRSALINNTVAQVGDRVAGATIVAIGEGEVQISIGSRDLIVQVGSTAAHGSPVGSITGSPVMVANSTTHSVQSGDTLSEISERYLQPGVSLNQMMVALYEANPAAFDGNINRLRAGAVLEIPDVASIRDTSRRFAATEVQRQHESWRSVIEAPPAVVAQDVAEAYGPVEYGETLSAIAVRLKPDGVRLHDMVAALFEANPEAFNGSADLLLEGAVLRIPDSLYPENLLNTYAAR